MKIAPSIIIFEKILKNKFKKCVTFELIRKQLFINNLILYSLIRKEKSGPICGTVAGIVIDESVLQMPLTATYNTYGLH